MKTVNIDKLLENGKSNGLRLVDLKTQCRYLTEYTITIFDREDNKYYQGKVLYGVDHETLLEEVTPVPSDRMEYVPLTSTENGV